jgi:hypothetical protein
VVEAGVSWRLAVLPRWQNVDAPQSLATVPLEMVSALLLADPDLTVLVAIPDGSHEDVLRWFAPIVDDRVQDRVFWHEAYRKMPVRMVGFAGSDRLARFADGADVVLSNQPGGVAALRRGTDRPIVLWGLWTACQRLLDMHDSRVWAEEDVAVECLATLYADVTVFESAAMQAETMRTLRQWVETRWPKSRVLPIGAQPSTPRQTGGTVLCGGNGTALKGRDQSLTIAAAVFRSGKASKAVVCCPEERPKIAAPGVEVYAGVNAAGWRAACAQSDVVVCNSRTESYGVAWLEALAAGAVVVYRDAWWVQGACPPGWPWIARSNTEQEEMVAALAADRALCAGWGVLGRSWVRTWHDPRRTQRDMLALLKDARDGRLG